MHIYMCTMNSMNHSGENQRNYGTRQRGCISMNAIYRIRSNTVRNLQYWDFLLNTASQNKYDDSY